MAPLKTNQGPKRATEAGFTKYEDIRKVLHAQTESALVEGLTVLRNQLSIKYSEDVVPASDERLLLAKAWLESDNAAQDLFDIWSQVNTRQTGLISIVLSILSCLVRLLSSHYTYHHLATPLIKAVLSPQWSTKLNTYLSTTHNELMLVTLKLYHSISVFPGGKESRNVFEAFPWELKSLPKLLNMRRKSKSSDHGDALSKPDIRTLYVLLLLSFVDIRAPSVVKAAFLEQRRDHLISTFKGLARDAFPVIRKVLETCWSGIWEDVKIKRTVKIGIFNENTIAQVLRLYERSGEEDGSSESVPADLAHHFLLAICTRPGTGVCFKDQGWYPREDEDDAGLQELFDDSSRRHHGRVFNKILSNVLKSLRVNEDPRQQELALRILQACPELVAGYWSAAALTLEPRLSSKWIANIAFFGSVISLPVPQMSFLLHDANLYRPNPPSLSTIMENILPTVNIKVHLSRGLQSPSALVQHCTALALGKCLTKYGAVLTCIREIQESLEEDEEDGLWSIRRREVEREASRRVPEFQVIVAFAQQKAIQAPVSVDGEVQQSRHTVTKAALLSESAQRLLWLYHRYIPQLAAEAHFDVTRVLSSIQEGASDHGPTTSLVFLRQLHTLRLLNESEEFSIMGKTGSSRGNLSTLLALYTSTSTHVIKGAVAELLKHSLSQTLLFQHDAHEVDLWLHSIPTSRRAPDAHASDGTPLTDETAAMIPFLDDCVQRCMKAPYRYLEDLGDLWSQNATETQGSSLISSPLLMTVIEQLEAKFTRDLLTPSDCLAVVAYVRKLVLRLAVRGRTLQPFYTLAMRLEFLVNKPGPSVVMAGIGREAQALLTGLTQLERPSLTLTDHNTEADAFLDAVEAEGAQHNIGALELIDWYRLLSKPLDQAQFDRLASITQQMNVAAVYDLLDYVMPGEGHVWHYVNAAHGKPIRQAAFAFETLFLHCSAEDMASEEIRRTLLDAAFAQYPTAEDLKRAFGMVQHRLSASDNDAICRDLLLLLVGMLERVAKDNTLPYVEVVQFIWQMPIIMKYARTPLTPLILPVFASLIAYSVSPRQTNQHIFEDYVDLWSATLKTEMSAHSPAQTSTALMWLQVMDRARLLDILDYIQSTADAVEHHANTVLEGVLLGLCKTLNEADDMAALASRLHQLRNLPSILPTSIAAKQVLAMAVKTCLPIFHNGLLGLPDSTQSLSSLMALAHKQWKIALSQHVEHVDVEQLILQDTKTSHDISVIAATMYKSASARAAVRRWMLSSDIATWPIETVSQVVYAFLDTSLDIEKDLDGAETVIVSSYGRILSALEEISIPEETRHVCGCLLSLVERLPVSVVDCILTSAANGKQEPSVYLFSAFANLTKAISEVTRDTVSKLTEHASRWIVAALSSDGALPNKTLDLISDFALTIKRFKSMNSRSAETLVMAAVQYRIQDKAVLLLINDVLGSVELKPVTVNRILQNIMQHPKFAALGRTGDIRYAEVRLRLVAILHSLFHLHPVNTCQSTHVEPLLPLYEGTMSEADCKLLSIFRLFETTKKTSIASLLVHWSTTPDMPPSTVLETVQSLDATRMLRTCLQFPQRVTTLEKMTAPADGEHIYNPVFVILVFSRMLIEGVPSTAPGWVTMFRTNIASMLIRALSAHSHDVRDTALTQLAGLYSVLQNADFQEKLHVLHIMDVLKDVYVKTTVEMHSPRLPVYITLHLAHALRGVFYPSNFTYPLTARFLLQRPELDVNDMPLLYSMLYSVSDQWRKERAWIVRFMSDGMVGIQEWKVLRKRHTWDLLASMFHSEESDLHLRRSILELLANITSERHAVTSLVLGSALLSWIELQLESIKLDEGLGWVKILENILATVDVHKLEASTGGEWRSIISRCLATLLQSPACSRWVLAYAVRVTLRLTTLAAVSVAEIDNLICLSLEHLTALEGTLSLPRAVAGRPQPAERILDCAPHRSHTLWKRTEVDELELWGQCVEMLWRAAMRVEEKCSSWDGLTTRLLVWRACAGRRTLVGEWVRREVIRNIRTE
ncbi:ribosome 60S biogenesis N-terminal-domain-containing protein [Cytidiella melzeri]|nr:ribosome 60S biogenesis N-terminal-domain-containing protein [Cytidiella melzeri]